MPTSRPQRKAGQSEPLARARKSPAAKKSGGSASDAATAKVLAVESTAGKKHKYKLKFHPEALEEWRALDNSVRQPLKKLLEKRLDNPHVPGGELHPPLGGCYKIKLRKAGVRLVYEVEADTVTVYVLAVDKREDDAAYAAATARVKALTADILAAAKKQK